MADKMQKYCIDWTDIVLEIFSNFYQNAFNDDMQSDQKKLNFDSAKMDCHVLAQLQALHAEV